MDVAELFEGFDASRYEAEAQERWPEGVAESRRRTANWSRDDAAGAAQRGVDLAQRLATLAAESVPVDDERTQEARLAAYDALHPPGRSEAGRQRVRTSSA